MGSVSSTPVSALTTTRLFIMALSLTGVLFFAVVTGTMFIGRSIHSLQYVYFEMQHGITLTDLRVSRSWTLPLNFITIPLGISWSPDGAAFITIVSDVNNRYRYDLFEMSRNHLRTAVTDLTRGAPPAWSPDGRQIAYIGASENLCVLRIDMLDAQPHCVDVHPEVPPAWSPDSTHLAVVVQGRGTENSRQLHILRADGQAEAHYPLTFHEVSGLDWSPNGQSIAISAANENTFSATYETRLEQIRNNWAVYSFDVATAEIVQISDSGLYIYDLSWSPDGSQLAFVMDFQRNRDVYVVSMGDDHETRRMTSTSGDEASLSWSSDGQWLAFLSREGMGAYAYLVEVALANPSPVLVDVGSVFHIVWRP